MKTKSFKFVGLNRIKGDEYMSATMEFEDGEFFHANIKGDNSHKESMWVYCKNHWSDRKIGILEYEKETKTGVPLNALLIEIREL